MDRIELVERLEERLKETQDKRNVLETKVVNAYERTWEYLDKRFEITQGSLQDAQVVFDGATVTSVLYVNGGYATQEDKYSLDRVIDLGHQIKECELKIQELESQLQKYKNNDFVAHLEKVMK